MIYLSILFAPDREGSGSGRVPPLQLSCSIKYHNICILTRKRHSKNSLSLSLFTLRIRQVDPAETCINICHGNDKSLSLLLSVIVSVVVVVAIAPCKQ